ncbi:HpcH/HpaI aldolase family protein [Devosia sp. CN2-171]|jgi:4-hydroxy-2-oxoheptanedioate aldolase|uniref:HpcH/HpaI aldolase family protein n=1 Tax=Devosia sp. CN2-171 TaxID=3400909 RepID=UPI003BF83F7A
MRPIPPNAFKRRLYERVPQLGYWLSLNSLLATEVAAGSGFEWVLLDMEHSTLSVETIEQHLLAAHHGGDAEFIVRVPSVDAVIVKRLLDAGVRNFMFPYVQTVEEARLAVAATRYPPAGIRGYSGNNRANRFGTDTSYPTSAHEQFAVILQVETPQALANIPAYGAIDGVDAIFIGPNDLAASIGLVGQQGHPDVRKLVLESGEAILATGKAAGMLDFNPSTAKPLLEAGFGFIAVGSDLSTVSSGTRQLLGAFGRG